MMICVPAQDERGLEARVHDHFGRAFEIRRGAETARSGCIAFGMERWLYALMQRFGAGGMHDAVAALEQWEVAV